MGSTQRKRGLVALIGWWWRQRPVDFFALHQHLRGYSFDKLGGDFKAGLNVALLAFPQGMAYAMIAGLPIEYGIYGSAVAAVIASLFARSRFITLGPTNATAVALGAAFLSLNIIEPEARAAVLPLVLLMVGGMLIIGALAGLAKAIQYISRTVVTGYITAAALFIIVGQMPKVLGLTLDGEVSTLATKVIAIARALPGTTLEPSLVSAATAILYYGLKGFRATRGLPNVAITLVAITVLTSLVGGWLEGSGWYDPAKIGTLYAVDATEWPVNGVTVDLEQMGVLADAALGLALLCVLEGISIGKSLAARCGARLHTDQEVYAIGMANVGCAFLGGMPASGSLTRSQLSFSSGGQTPVASILTGLMLTGGVFAVGRFIQYIPVPVLSMLVITIGLSLFDRRAFRVATRATRDDRTVFWATFLGGVFLQLITAIYLGAILSIILFLRRASTPELTEFGFDESGQLSETPGKGKRSMPAISIIHAEGDLFFGAAEIFRDQMRRVSDDPDLKIVVCKMRNARHVDATSIMAIEELVRYMNENGRYLILSEVRPSIMAVMERSGLLDFLNGDDGQPFVFADTPENPTLSTAQALKRARQLLGGQDAEVTILVKPKEPHDGE